MNKADIVSLNFTVRDSERELWTRRSQLMKLKVLFIALIVIMLYRAQPTATKDTKGKRTQLYPIALKQFRVESCDLDSGTSSSPDDEG